MNAELEQQNIQAADQDQPKRFRLVIKKSPESTQVEYEGEGDAVDAHALLRQAEQPQSAEVVRSNNSAKVAIVITLATLAGLSLWFTFCRDIATLNRQPSIEVRR